MSEYQILFLPARQSSSFEEGTTFLDAALELGILIESTCAGLGDCAKCRVVIPSGATPPGSVEERLLTPQELEKGVRLSCQARVSSKGVCLVPETSRLVGDQIMVEGYRGALTFKPDLRKVHCTLDRPELGMKYFDAEELGRRLGVPVNSNLRAVRDLPGLLQAHDYSVTAVIDQDRLIGVEGGDTTARCYGVAVDIGTTTVATKLVDLCQGRVAGVASALNPQKSYGADVVSRIHYCIEHEGGLELMHRLIVRQISELIGKLCTQAGIESTEVYKISVAANTVMQHFFLKIDPRSVATMPYAPAFQGPITVGAAELGIPINPVGVVYVLPNLGSFVGSDITSVLSVLTVHESEAIQLVVDIGTNGEMVLGSKTRIICCSSPAGPAWEGATIAWGMRAAHGAIERAEIIDGDLQIRTIGGVQPIGICGSGLLDLVCEFVRAGLIDASGRILGRGQLSPQVPERLKERILETDGKVNHVRIAPVGNNEHILLTQKDIREVQLAKGAIASGIAILMKVLGVSAEQIAAVYIAGAFGNHVRGKDAVDSGLIPPVDPSRIHFIGNAALSGAEAVLLSQETRRRAEELSRTIEYVEISDRADFQDTFVEAMSFRGRP
jgi:uncharacterized 2Fe-2S/4Fe-4S cluster protein (DUF4445 family)